MAGESLTAINGEAGSKTKAQYAIFDLDGTLLDYEAASHEALHAVLSRFGAAFSVELHSAIIGSRHTFWSNYLIDQCNIRGQVTPDDFVKFYHEEIELRIDTTPLMPGAEQLVRALKQAGIPIAIATSSSGKIVPKKIARHAALRECVDLIVTGDDPEVLEGKPAPDIFLLAAKRLGADAHNSVVFEDSPFGVLGGIRAGMHVIAVPDPRFLGPSSLDPAIFEHAQVSVFKTLSEVDVSEHFVV